MQQLAFSTLFLVLFFLVHWIPPLSLVKPFTARQFHLHWNWLWATDCLIAAVGFSSIMQVRMPTRRPTAGSFAIGFSLGIALQFAFQMVGLRPGFAFHGFQIETLCFQIFTSVTEEILFRGVIQNYLSRPLQSRLSPTGARWAAGIYISLLFGLMHGVNPLLRGHGAFDSYRFLSSVILSLGASTLYAFSPVLTGAIGMHLAYNLIAHFF